MSATLNAEMFSQYFSNKHPASKIYESYSALYTQDSQSTPRK